MSEKPEKTTSEVKAKTIPTFNYKECYNCSQTIYIVGQKFCSDYCKENYHKKLEAKFS